MNDLSPPQQLHLSVSIRDDATFNNFYRPLGSKNASVIATIERELASVRGSLVYLWGARGCGLSHVLQGACHSVQSRHKNSVYLPLADVVGYAPDSLLAGLESQYLVCLDGLQYIAGNPQWEVCLFELYNRVMEQNVHMLVAASCAPRQINIQLEDLRSRLSAGHTFQLESLSDEEKPVALQQRAHARGMEMSDEVVNFIFSRAPRDMGDLFCILERLDELTLSAQRRLTIPFVKEVLGW